MTTITIKGINAVRETLDDLIKKMGTMKVGSDDDPVVIRCENCGQVYLFARELPKNHICIIDAVAVDVPPKLPGKTE